MKRKSFPGSRMRTDGVQKVMRPSRFMHERRQRAGGEETWQDNRSYAKVSKDGTQPFRRIQQPLLVLAAPSETLIGVHTVRSRHAGHSGAWCRSLFHNLALQFRTAVLPLDTGKCLTGGDCLDRFRIGCV
jgi:hypothetical protein